ncbi:putative exonuclease [Trypanosoma rangeli]|uniref:Putative exonuclease n=1 Tax=Trypanosoma rangeli TaxID=5698 RepID=A0A422NXM4_TRYRA|nr:putative exonuclease [Trypanosoma rangeli]RNF10292.1 putative exonuclease [Trypanosoma rangeli]|eukprot:RNF10292.1 putative exonuclease [Trypanosoma rangeli]
MGIKGLWSEVRPVCRQSHLSNFRGQRVAVDMYVWLHRGILGSVQLGTSADAEAFIESVEATPDAADAVASVRLTNKFLQFVMGRVELMLRCGIHPVLVFDGAPIPMKRGTEEERQQLRAARLAEAVQLIKDGSASNPCARQEAAQLLEKGVDITTELAHAVIQVLQERRLECIVAPYEADAQLAYLCKEGYVQAVISEDSDLIAYHCPCLIAKLDGHGNCEVLVAQDLPRCPSFYGLSYESFLVGCILSGCDYLPSLRHIGVKKAFRLVAQATSVPSIMSTLQVKFGFSKEELDEYGEKLQQAFYCFAHHFVFDPVRKEVMHLTPLPRGIPLNTNLLGKTLQKDVAEKVCAECLYDPVTKALYRGSYQYCVQEYWRHVRGGQTSLKAYSGFQDMQSPRVTILLRQGGADATGQRASPTTTFFSSPLQKVCEATGFCKQATRSTTLVRSKYFTQGRWKVEDWESDESEDTPTMTTQTTATFDSSMTTAAAGNDGEVSEGSQWCMSSLRFVVKDAMGATPQSVSQPSTNLTQEDGLVTQQQQQQASFSLPEAPDALLSPIIPPSVPKPPHGAITASDHKESQCRHGGSGCPFGYPQCGRRHSIFELCFQGKHWAKNPTPLANEGVKNTSDGESSHSCGGELSCSSLRTGTGEKRQRGTAMPLSFRPVFRQPASTSGTSTASASHAEKMSSAAKRRLLSPTDQAVQLMQRLNPRSNMAPTVSSKAEDTGRGNEAATKLFEELTFARR